MDAENEKLRRVKIMQLDIQANAKKMKAIKQVFSSIGETLKAFNDYGHQMEETKKLNLSKCFDYIKHQISSLNDTTATCKFLLGEKLTLNAKIIDSNIRQNGYDRKHYESILTIIIEPLFKHYQDELEFQKNNPQQKQIEIAPLIETVPKSNEIVPATKVVETIPELPDGFSQIECNATKEEILNYFMILAKEKNHLTGEFFMTEEVVIEFVHKNFSVFNLAPSGKYFSINLLPKQKSILIHFIYWFYVKYDQSKVDTKKKYANLLNNNFKLFIDDKPRSLMTNMRESKKPKKGAIPITKYFLK